METMKIKATSPSQGDFVVINKSDFDPAIHEAFDHVERKEEATETTKAEVKRGRKGE